MTATIFQNEQFRKEVQSLSDKLSQIGFYGSRLAILLVVRKIENEEQLPKPDQSFYTKLFQCLAGISSDSALNNMKTELKIPTINIPAEYAHSLVLLGRQMARNVTIHFRAMKARVVSD